MKEQLISFETAKLAKEKGFDEECHKIYNKLEQLISRGHQTSRNSEKEKICYLYVREGWYLSTFSKNPANSTYGAGDPDGHWYPADLNASRFAHVFSAFFSLSFAFIARSTSLKSACVNGS